MLLCFHLAQVPAAATESQEEEAERGEAQASLRQRMRLSIASLPSWTQAHRAWPSIRCENPLPQTTFFQHSDPSTFTVTAGVGGAVEAGSHGWLMVSILSLTHGLGCSRHGIWCSWDLVHLAELFANATDRRRWRSSRSKRSWRSGGWRCMARRGGIAPGWRRSCCRTMWRTASAWRPPSRTSPGETSNNMLSHVVIVHSIHDPWRGGRCQGLRPVGCPLLNSGSRHPPGGFLTRRILRHPPGGLANTMVKIVRPDVEVNHLAPSPRCHIWQSGRCSAVSGKVADVSPCLPSTNAAS